MKAQHTINTCLYQKHQTEGTSRSLLSHHVPDVNPCNTNPKCTQTPNPPPGHHHLHHVQSQPPRSGHPPITNHLSTLAVGKRVSSTADAVRESVPSKPTRTRWSPLNAKVSPPTKTPQRQAASDISPSTYIPFPRQGHPKGGRLRAPADCPKRKTGRHLSFRWPVCATCGAAPDSLDRILYAAGGQVCAVVVGNVECAEIGAAAAGLGLVGGCLRLVAAGETSPASGVERRRGAGRALFGWVMGRGNVTGGGCGFWGFGDFSLGWGVWSLFWVSIELWCLC